MITKFHYDPLKEHNSTKGDTLDYNFNTGQLFFMTNLFMKFQNCNLIFVTDAQTDALTDGYLFGTYSVRKSSQEGVSTQQIPVNFYGINLILRENSEI